MAEFSIKPNEQDLRRILKKLDNLAEMDFKKPLGKSGKIVQDSIDENFEKQGALFQGGGFVRSGGAFANLSKATTSGGVWKTLAQSTKVDRLRKGYGIRPILVRSGKLKDGFRRPQVTKDRMTIVNRVPYGIHHQTGGARLPQRRIIGFTKKTTRAIQQVFINHIVDIIKGF